MPALKTNNSVICGLLLAAATLAPLPMQAAPAKPAPHVAAKAATPPASVLSAPDDVPASTSEYTGVVVDARGLSDILRSPAPAIYGAGSDGTLVYPDRAHVPTPDEVQDESIVRYYHTPAEAAQGVGGSHPLVVTAVAVLGPAKDALQISPADMRLLLEADKSLHFTRSWRVGFLVPADK